MTSRHRQVQRFQDIQPYFQFLLKDEFSESLSSGSVNGTFATTGQTRNVTDTANKLSIVSANGLRYTGSTGAGNPGLWYSTFNRQIGLAVGWRVNPVSGTHGHEFGFSNTTSGDIRDGVYFVTGGLRAFFNQNQRDMLGSVYSNNTTYDCVTISRNQGCWIAIKGGVYSDWSLGFVSINGTSNLIPSTTVSGALGTCVVDSRKTRVTKLSYWNNQYSNVTERKAVSVNSDTINSNSGNCLIEHTIIAATGVTQELMVRRTDNNNCIIIRCDQTNSTIKVYEKNAGVETELTGGTTSQTWTNGASFRIFVSLYGNTIRVTVNTSAKNNATSTGFNANATGVRVSHAGTDLISWPIDLPSSVKLELNKLVPP